MVIDNQPWLLVCAIVMCFLLSIFTIVDSHETEEVNDVATTYDQISLNRILVLMFTRLWDKKVADKEGTRGTLIIRM